MATVSRPALRPVVMHGFRHSLPPYRSFSSSFARKGLSMPSGCLTAAFAPAESASDHRHTCAEKLGQCKSRVLRKTTQALAALAARSRRQTAQASHPRQPGRVVVLVSKGLAGWLQDDAFLGGLVAPLVGREQAQGHLLLTAAVVDKVPGAHGAATEGISLLFGRHFDQDCGLDDEACSPRERQDASIAFCYPGGLDRLGEVHVTLPLANTLFENGRASTMFASKWSWDGVALVQTERRRVVRTTVDYTPCNHHSFASRLDVPLLPITQPRRILAGLGNILRQIDMNGVPTPASQELETLMPKLLEARSKLGGKASSAPGPMAVWALVMPEHLFLSENTERAHMKPADVAGHGQAKTGAERDHGCELGQFLARGLGEGAQLMQIRTCRHRRALQADGKRQTAWLTLV